MAGQGVLPAGFNEVMRRACGDIQVLYEGNASYRIGYHGSRVFASPDFSQMATDCRRLTILCSSETLADANPLMLASLNALLKATRKHLGELEISGPVPLQSLVGDVVLTRLSDLTLDHATELVAPGQFDNFPHLKRLVVRSYRHPRLDLTCFPDTADFVANLSLVEAVCRSVRLCPGVRTLHLNRNNQVVVERPEHLRMITMGNATDFNFSGCRKLTSLLVYGPATIALPDLQPGALPLLWSASFDRCSNLTTMPAPWVDLPTLANLHIANCPLLVLPFCIGALPDRVMVTGDAVVVQAVAAARLRQAQTYWTPPVSHLLSPLGERHRNVMLMGIHRGPPNVRNKLPLELAVAELMSRMRLTDFTAN